jgi:hypothetical protein
MSPNWGFFLFSRTVVLKCKVFKWANTDRKWGLFSRYGMFFCFSPVYLKD